MKKQPTRNDLFVRYIKQKRSLYSIAKEYGMSVKRLKEKMAEKRVFLRAEDHMGDPLSAAGAQRRREHKARLDRWEG